MINIIMSYLLTEEGNIVSHIDGKIPWYRKNSWDVQNFKELTTKSGYVFMGRSTFESLPAPLPNRQHYVYTASDRLENSENVKIYSSWYYDLYDILFACDARNGFVIGGEKFISSLILANTFKYNIFGKSEITRDMEFHITLFCEDRNKMLKYLAKNILPANLKCEFVEWPSIDFEETNQLYYCKLHYKTVR